MQMVLKQIERLGEYVLWHINELGGLALFLMGAIRGIFRRPFRFAAFLNEIRFIGANSFVVIFFTAAFTGMVLGVQGYYTLSQFGSEGLLGSAVALSLIRELGPVLTALMVTGRAGSAMCAELGIMRITQQVDALECMAIDPYRFLITPKFLATIVAVPLLTLIFDVVGIFGGYFSGVILLGVNPGAFFSGMEQSVANQDINLGIIKSFFFAFIIVWICAGKGFLLYRARVGFGSGSVSRVTTRAVVLSSITVLIWDYLITALLL
jgi:phospholipid/cholesterol/gamma-HCH transport system permease protein